MSKRRILLVDDEADMLMATKMQLESKDFEVITAVDGQEALNLARKDSPDLIILDLMLPKLDGYKVCRMLKFDEKYKTIPIIMLTARIQDDDEKLGYEVGADVYITKPFESDELLNKINELVNKSS